MRKRKRETDAEDNTMRKIKRGNEKEENKTKNINI